MIKMQIKNPKRLTALLLTGTLSIGTLASCGYSSVVEDQTEIYDVIDSNNLDEIVIEPQVLDVPGEDFKLVVEYSLDEDTRKKWRITDNKSIYTKVYTIGLDENTKVYIDNIHTDTSIVSSKEAMNGIPQDSMDDHIHNSLMYGFPISDNISYYAKTIIDGQNDTFIKGSSYGFNGYSSGTIVERRHSEQEYLAAGVYANKISSAYGLLIQKGEAEPYGVDVSSDIIVIVCNQIVEKDKDGNIIIYTYERNGSYTTESQDVKVKTK